MPVTETVDVGIIDGYQFHNFHLTLTSDQNEDIGKLNLTELKARDTSCLNICHSIAKSGQ